MEGMKKMIVEEVNSFRSMVRAQARAAQGRKDGTYVILPLEIRSPQTLTFLGCSLPIPSREDVIASPLVEGAPVNGATSSFTAPEGNATTHSPIMEDPSDALEKELAGTHIDRGVA